MSIFKNLASKAESAIGGEISTELSAGAKQFVPVLEALADKIALGVICAVLAKGGSELGIAQTPDQLASKARSILNAVEANMTSKPVVPATVTQAPVAAQASK